MMTEVTIQLSDLLDWSPAKRVETRNGPRMLRKATPNERFWEAWKQHKQTLKDAGISCARNNFGLWEVCWWQELEGEAAQQVNESLQASRATDADITIPAPAGCEYLPYQRAGIKYAIDRPACLIGDEMGLGKTIQAIGVWNLDTSLKSVLVVCPASLRINWMREFTKWSVRPVRIAIVNGGRQRDWNVSGASTADIVIINYDVLEQHRVMIDRRQFDLLIGDECQYAKNVDAKRTRALHGFVDKTGKRVVQAIQARRKVFLSGTPLMNRPKELWTLVQQCDPNGLGRNFFGFHKRYCGARHNGYGWDFNGATKTDELQRLLRERFMVRRLKAEVLKELPPKRYQVVEVPCDSLTQHKQIVDDCRRFDSYRNFVAEAEAKLSELEDRYGDEAYLRDDYRSIKQSIRDKYGAAFEELAEARHRVAEAKRDAVTEIVETALENGPVILFAWHADVIEHWKRYFGDRAVVVTGQTPMSERQGAVDAFQSGKVDLFIGNILAAGVGLTLTRSSHVIFAELTFVPAQMQQAADRAHRIGQLESVLIQYVVLEDSIDVYLADMLINKQKVCDEVLGDLPEELRVEHNGNGKSVDEVLVDLEGKVKSEIEKQKPAAITLKIEPGMPEEQKAAIHRCLRILAGMCDGALKRDNVGFNGTDSRYGKFLASLDELTERQLASGRKMIVKYHRQLPKELLQQAKGSDCNG